MKIAILGAGHGGLAMSADLKLTGHNVKLSVVEEHSLNLKLLKAIQRLWTLCIALITQMHTMPITSNIMATVLALAIIFTQVFKAVL